MSVLDIETHPLTVPEVTASSRPQGILRRVFSSFCHSISYQRRRETPDAVKIEVAAMDDPIDKPQELVTPELESGVTATDQEIVITSGSSEIMPEHKEG